MKIALILLFLTERAISELNSNNDTNKELIFNGEKLNRDKYPYVVFCSIAYGQYYCTGTLIRPLYVLTAAHCTHNQKKEEIQVYNGPKNGKDFRTCVELHVHEGYDPKSVVVRSDLSVLKLNKHFPNAKSIGVGFDTSIFDDMKEVKCTFIGFGDVNDDNHNVEGLDGYTFTGAVRYGQKACKGWQREEIQSTWKQYLCSVPGKSMVCKGDSGGPMVCNNKLYGVCSFFINWLGKPTKCGGKSMQTIHIYIQYFKPWLDNIVKTEKEEDKTHKYKSKKKHKKKKNAGISIVAHHTFYVVFAVLWFHVLCFY